MGGRSTSGRSTSGRSTSLLGRTANHFLFRFPTFALTLHHRVHHVIHVGFSVLAFLAFLAFRLAFQRPFKRKPVFKRQVRHKGGHCGLLFEFRIQLSNFRNLAPRSLGTQRFQHGHRHARGHFVLALPTHCNPQNGVQVHFQQPNVSHAGYVADFNVQFHVFATHYSQKPGLLHPRPDSPVCALHHLFSRFVIRHPLPGGFFGFHQPIFNKPGHYARCDGILANALRNVRVRSNLVIVIGDALVSHAQFPLGFIDDRENHGHAPHDVLRPYHGRIGQIGRVPNVHDFHGRHSNAAKLFNAVAARALQELPRFAQQRVQTLAQHVIHRVVVIIVRISISDCPPEIRPDVHVGFRIELAHNFAREPVVVAFHEGCNAPPFSDFAVQAHDLGFRQHRNKVVRFGPLRRVHAIHLFALPRRVVFDQRGLKRAVQNLEQAVQRHCEPHDRAHDEVHRLNPAFNVPQLGRILPFGMHSIHDVHRLVVLNERRVNQPAGLVQQFRFAFCQLLPRHDALFVQIRVIQFDNLGIT